MWVWMAVAFASEPQPVSGTFTIDEPAQVVSARHAKAVEDGLLGLPWGFRPFARGPLTGAVFDCGTLQLSLGADGLSSQCDSKRKALHPIGASSHVNDAGNAVSVACSVQSGAPSVRFTTSEGGKALKYVPQADGGLVVQTEIFSDRLPVPIRWATRYRRVP